MDNEGQVHKVSDGKEDSKGHRGKQKKDIERTRNNSCHIQVTKLSSFCSCPKLMYEAEFTDNNLIILVEEISRQPHVQGVAWYWSLFQTDT